MNIYIVVLGFIAWLAFSLGGVGDIMYIGPLIEIAFGRESPYMAWVAWPTVVVALTVWRGSLAGVASNFHVLFRSAGELLDSSVRITGEWLIRLGHV